MRDLATDVLWETLPGPVQEALEQVWEFIKGCAAFVGDTLGSIKEVFTHFGQVLTDPGGFIHERLDVAKGMYDGLRADSVAFSKQFLGDAVEWPLLQSNPAQWAGKVGCELAVAVLTGGLGESERFASVVGDVNKVSRQDP